MGSYKKKLFIVLLLTLLIGCFVCGSVNAVTYYQENTTYNVEMINFLHYEQELYACMFLKKFEELATDSEREQLKYYFEHYSYVFKYINNNTNKVAYAVVFYPSDTSFYNFSSDNINTNDTLFQDSYISYPVTGYNLDSSDTLVFRSYITNNTITIYQEVTWATFIPTFDIYYTNQTVQNYLNGISPTQSSLAMIINAIQENTDEQEEQTEEMKKLNNFMSSEDVDEDAYDMPTSNPTQDITESGINGIFTMFYDKINNWESENITIRIPFANKIFIIPSDLTENIVNSYLPNTTTFGRLFGLIWYYLLGVYIVKDIQKYIDGLQTGEILTKSDTNIKTEML